MNKSDAERQLLELRKKVKRIADRASLYEEESRVAKAALEVCQTSASYKLGHLLIHEIVIIKDILKFLHRRNIFRKKSSVNRLNGLGESLIKSTRAVREFEQSPPVFSETRLNDGISIILPTYKGEETILRTLTSLAKQDLPHDLFEIIVIINGEKDDTESLITQFSKENPTLRIRTHCLDDSGASLARNAGIREIQHQYTVLIDDDDSVSPNYLRSLYELAADDTIVLSQIINVDSDSVDASNVINLQILGADPASDNLLSKCPSALTINASKLIPSKYMKLISFDTSLGSGEDVVYFSELFSRYSFNFRIAKEAIYFRFMRDNSVSRQPLSFAFNVQERLRVITSIFGSLDNTQQEDVLAFLRQKISAQTSFINIYLKEFPDEYERTLREIKTFNLHSFPYDKLRKRSAAKDLIVSYCFTPFVDTSAIVMAKRVREQGKIVDVAYNNMSSVRTKDERLNALADELIDTRIPIGSPTSFSQWHAVEAFSASMIERLKQLNKGRYETLYSRVLWPASNFAAFEYKLISPETHWIAEFSDPILYDIHGKARYSKIDGEWHYSRIRELLSSRGLTMPTSDNLYFWCEYLAYAFADELIFTNQNQLTYMLGKADPEIHEVIQDKATIKCHPTLSKEYYEVQQSDYALDAEKVNLAYFGNFYQTRKLNDICEAVKALPQEYKAKVVVHVFTNSQTELAETIEKEGLSENFRILDFVSFFEFLNLTTKFDCLVLNDAITKPEKSVNPYLPSKLSDYKGSSQSIWVLYEEGSLLHRSDDIRYKSELGKVQEGCRVLQAIVDDR